MITKLNSMQRSAEIKKELAIIESCVAANCVANNNN